MRPPVWRVWSETFFPGETEGTEGSEPSEGRGSPKTEDKVVMIEDEYRYTVPSGPSDPSESSMEKPTYAPSRLESVVRGILNYAGVF